MLVPLLAPGSSPDPLRSCAMPFGADVADGVSPFSETLSAGEQSWAGAEARTPLRVSKSGRKKQTHKAVIQKSTEQQLGNNKKGIAIKQANVCTKTGLCLHILTHCLHCHQTDFSYLGRKPTHS